MKTTKMGRFTLKDCVTSPELAEIKVSYKNRPTEKIKISCSRDAYEIFYQIFDKDTINYQEQAYVIFLNRANFVLGWLKLSHGGISGTVIDPKVIFSVALLTGSSCLVLCHNHPSGLTAPSKSDLELTYSISQAGKFLSITLLDHLIIGQEGAYYSFADEGTI